jgi:NAD(P)-dependent dehydrogenase (short-subunit alcohol dehydrogenase family)
MSSSPEKSVSYIIGGSSGMGLATAKLLVADGATVVVIGRDAKKLERRWRSHGRPCLSSEGSLPNSTRLSSKRSSFHQIGWS